MLETGFIQYILITFSFTSVYTIQNVSVAKNVLCAFLEMCPERGKNVAPDDDVHILVWHSTHFQNILKWQNLCEAGTQNKNIPMNTGYTSSQSLLFQ